MSALSTAATQALEALETCDAAHISDGGRQWYDDKAVEEAITALKAALAEPVQEPVRGSEMRRCPRCWEPMFPPQRKPLPQAEIERLYITAKTPMAFARSIEQAHGITS